MGSGTACCGWSNELTAGLQRPPCSSNALVSVTCWRKALGGCVALSVFKVSVILDGGDDKHNPSVQKRCRGKVGIQVSIGSCGHSQGCLQPLGTGRGRKDCPLSPLRAWPLTLPPQISAPNTVGVLVLIELPPPAPSVWFFIMLQAALKGIFLQLVEERVPQGDPL